MGVSFSLLLAAVAVAGELDKFPMQDFDLIPPNLNIDEKGIYSD